MKPAFNPLRPSVAQRAAEAQAFKASLRRHGEQPLSYRQLHRNQVNHKRRSNAAKATSNLTP